MRSEITCFACLSYVVFLSSACILLVSSHQAYPSPSTHYAGTNGTPTYLLTYYADIVCVSIYARANRPPVV